MKRNPPNVLLFLPDQWRADWLGCAGLRGLRTPVIDRLAAGGVRFTRCVTPSPVCAPARAALAQGCTYEECGVPNNRHNMPLDPPTVYRHLRSAGYAVASFGKLDLAKALNDHGGDGTRRMAEWGFTHGFDSEGKWDGVQQMQKPPLTGPYGQYLDKLGLREIYLEDMRRRGAGRNYANADPSPLSPEAYGDNWIARNAIDCLRELPRQPWFLQVNFMGPHEPMDWPAWEKVEIADDDLPPVAGDPPADPELHRRIQRAYAAMLQNIDSLCGRILQAVADRGELENTIVIFSSDHGEMLGDHGKWGKSTWEAASVFVPLVIAGPGVTHGAVTESMIQLQDLSPTILELAGAEPLNSSAQSFASLLRDPQHPHRTELVSALNDWRCRIDSGGLHVTRSSATAGAPDRRLPG